LANAKRSAAYAASENSAAAKSREVAQPPNVEPEKVPEPTLKEKLDTLGIPLSDLKTALEAI
jgi:hypothetical protein